MPLNIDTQDVKRGVRSFASAQFAVWMLVFFVAWGVASASVWTLGLPTPAAVLVGIATGWVLSPVQERLGDAYVEAQEVDGDAG
jgi:hypothetical protein